MMIQSTTRTIAASDTTAFAHSPAAFAHPPVPDLCSDEQLLGARGVSKRAAFDELDRRYRGRIRELAVSMHFNDQDAEDIVQDTLLELFRSHETSGATCSLDIISRLTAASILAKDRGQRRRRRLTAALVAQARHGRST